MISLNLANSTSIRFLNYSLLQFSHFHPSLKSFYCFYCMELLTLDDFKHTKFDPNCTPFHYLLEVARVGQQKLRNGEEKKGHNSYLKCFLYNVPHLQTLCEEENIGFKQGKNVGLKRKLKLKEADVDEESKGLTLKRRKKEKLVCAIPSPDLPESFKQHIVENMGGSDWVLVIQKQVFYSDVNPQASRFSMPFSQLKTHEFLNKTEAEDLEDVNNALEVCLLEPSMKETTVTFKRWKYRGKSSSYVMTRTWNSVVKNNRLKIDDIVQLWSFRVKSKLCFALVKVQVSTRN
ncbi:B3 domain-containing protein At2g31420-like [Durio zibethinus]|uniref:B3 domain-containing protein At2g31420-like n=1 Tax=Durio zibethinus TaxID=66656 RepID=A0A6P6BEW0_DURZI|nr:B3 domain-containing protein At2g31420-like [Durio zibethinus]